MTNKARVLVVALGSATVALATLFFRVGISEDKHWHPWDGPTVQRDLSDIAGDTLRILVLRDPLVWEQRQRTTTGLEYELLQRFARTIERPIAVRSFDDADSLLAALWEGKGDVAAAQWVVHKEWTDHFRASRPFASVLPLVAKLRASKDSASEPLDRLPTSSASPFAPSDYVFDRSFVTSLALTSTVTEDELLMQVVLGESKAALISDLRAGYEAERFPILEFSPAIGPPQDLRFVVRASSPELQAALDAWMTDTREIEARKHFIEAYSDEIPAPGPLRARRAKGLGRDSISPFDAHFREHASVRGWGWELLAAMAWKENRFDSTVTSRKGAMGIMQFMPGTAEHLGLDSSSTMEEHIQAAARYLSRLDTIWLRAVPDREQRLRFVLASYNAGPGHIIDAQRLAEHVGLDPAKWEDNVERAVLLLAKPRYFLRPELKNGYCKGSQVFHYVRGVLAVYEQLRARSGVKASREKEAIASAERSPGP